MAAFGHKKCRSEVEVVEVATFNVHKHGNITRDGKISGVVAETLVSTDANGNVRASNTLNADVSLKSLKLGRELATIYTANVPATGWSTSAPYTQTVAVNGITENDTPDVDIDLSAAAAEDVATLEDAFANIGRAVTGNGTITLYCYSVAPDVDIPIRLRALR